MSQVFRYSIDKRYLIKERENHNRRTYKLIDIRNNLELYKLSYGEYSITEGFEMVHDTMYYLGIEIPAVRIINHDSWVYRGGAFMRNEYQFPLFEDKNDQNIKNLISIVEQYSIFPRVIILIILNYDLAIYWYTYTINELITYMRPCN